jgi:hypothetical protein
MTGGCNCLCPVGHRGRLLCTGGSECLVVVDVADTFLHRTAGDGRESVVMCGPCADVAEDKPRTVSVIRLGVVA